MTTRPTSLAACILTFALGALGPFGALAPLDAAVVTEVRLGATPGSELLNELQQSVALLPAGGYAVVWTQGLYPARAVRLQLVRADGSRAFPGEGLLVGSPQLDNSSPVVVAHARSGALVAWLQQSRSGTGGGRVVVQWIDARGVRRWPGAGTAAVALVEELAYHAEPRLVAHPDGGVFACFMVNSFAFGVTPPVGCQRFGPDGKRLWSEAGRQAGGASGWRVLPAPMSDGAGGLLVFWRNQRDLFDETIEPMLLEGQRFAPDGRRLWGDGRLVHTTNLAESNSYTHDVYDAVPDGRGGAVLAWDDSVAEGEPSYDVAAQRVDGDGERLWGDGVTVVAGALEEHQSALVAIPGGGAFVAVWEVSAPTRSRLLLFRLRANGRHFWAPEGLALSDPAARALDFGAYGTFDGGLLRMAWTTQRRPDTFTFDVRLAIFDLAGRRSTPAAGIPLSSAPNGQFLRGLIFDQRRGQGFAVWEDRRRGISDAMDVYGALYRED